MLSDINNQFRWQQREDVACNKKLIPFWALLTLKYLPYLLNKATRSEELIILAKMWSYRSFPPSLFRHDAKKVGKAVRHYLARFDGKEQRESIAVGPPLLSIVSERNDLKFGHRNELLACLTPPSNSNVHKSQEDFRALSRTHLTDIFPNKLSSRDMHVQHSFAVNGDKIFVDVMEAQGKKNTCSDIL